MERALLEAKGTSATLQVFEDKVVLQHPKWTGKSDRAVFFNQISSVEFRNAEEVRNGYFRLVYPGADGGITPFNASSDEHTVVFDSSQQDAFRQVKELVESKMAARSSASVEPGNEKCPNCGAPNRLGSNACSYCGIRLASAQTATPIKTNVSNQQNEASVPVNTEPKAMPSKPKKLSGCLIVFLVFCGVFGFFIFLAAIVSIFGPDADKLVMTAQSELEARNYDKAIENYTHAIEIWDGESDHQYVKTEVEKELKRAQIAGSIEKLNQALVELRGGNLDAALELASAGQRYDPANKELEALVSQINASIVRRETEKHIEAATKAFEDGSMESAFQSVLAAAKTGNGDPKLNELRHRFRDLLKKEVDRLLEEVSEPLENWDAKQARGNVEKAAGLLPDDKAVVSAKKRLAQIADAISAIGEKPYVTLKGSVLCVTRYFNENLNDPDSVQYIEWSPVTHLYYRGQHYWAVRVKFRAKNSFGGYVIEEKVAWIQNDAVQFMTDYQH